MHIRHTVMTLTLLALLMTDFVGMAHANNTVTLEDVIDEAMVRATEARTQEQFMRKLRTEHVKQLQDAREEAARSANATFNEEEFLSVRLPLQPKEELFDLFVSFARIKVPNLVQIDSPVAQFYGNGASTVEAYARTSDGCYYMTFALQGTASGIKIQQIRCGH